jgi:thiamine phosphate synthase YjbQ (UPF0047 family)
MTPLKKARMAQPLELTIELQPRARFDAIDVRARIAELYGDVLSSFHRTLFASHHTTAGYLEQGLAARLTQRDDGITNYVEAFRTVFPEGAGYRHDALDERTELSDEQRAVEPRNADSHLTFMAAGLRACVTYHNHRVPALFVDLDGVNDGHPRRRFTSIVGYNEETVVARTRIAIPVSAHPIDSINLREPGLGIYDQLNELIRRYDVTKGRLRLDLAEGERQAGLTVNEYETLLMRHDLVDVLRNPLRFVAEKGRHALNDPRAIPAKTRDYVKYDLVRVLNKIVDALGLHESILERAIARAMAVPAERLLRMKRTVNLLVSDARTPGNGTIVQGTYQSPIPVQWRQAHQGVRYLDVTLARLH